MSKNNVWYLAGPFHQYREDVKALAKQHALRIIDANATDIRDGEADEVPEVTIRPELQAVESESAAVDESVAQALRANQESVSHTIESFVSGDLRCFGDSDLAVRLFQVLEAVNHGVQSMQRERDVDAQKVVDLEKEKADLLKQIEAFKTGNADPEVEALKTALDKAGVSYRANASKESLQKQVAELGQQ